MSWLAPALGISLGLWFPAAFALAVQRHGRKGGVHDRLTVVDSLLTALVGVLVAYLWVPWGAVPAVLWAIPVALTVYAVVLAVPLWRRLPWVTGRTWLRVLGTVLGAAVTVLLFAMVV